MKVAMIQENPQAKAAMPKSIDNDAQPLDTFRYAARWHLKFLAGMYAVCCML